MTVEGLGMALNTFPSISPDTASKQMDVIIFQLEYPHFWRDGCR
jgi:hypothetical protein